MGGRGDDGLERDSPPLRRRRAHSNRQTVAAAARFSDSALPWCGTRTVASADRQRPRRAARAPRCRTRTPIGPVRSTRVQVLVAVRRPSRGSRIPRRAAPAIAAAVSVTADDRQVEHRPGRRAHGLRVVRSTELAVNTTPPAPAASAERSTVPAFPGRAPRAGSRCIRRRAARPSPTSRNGDTPTIPVGSPSR